jgi:hypothetical protein
MRFECNCPSCRGEGPYDDEGPEPSDEFMDEWIDDNREEVADSCLEKIQAATGTEEPSDEQIEDWISNHRDTVIDYCIEKINTSWESYLEGCAEEAAIARADYQAEIEKDRRHDY